MAGIENGSLTAVVVGGTGLVGNILIDLLLKDVAYGRVVTLSRKRIEKNSSKFENHFADLFDPDTYSNELKGDHLFICTGTTQAKTPDKSDYYRIEHDLPLLVAETALANGIRTLVAISALDANPKSKFSYNRGKGEMERDLEKLGFDNSFFVQPALIGGDREEKRPFERMWKKVQKVFDPLLLGSLKKYRTIHPKTIALSMIYLAKNGYTKNRIESDELKRIAGLERN